MAGKNPQVDAYIARAQPFAQPILSKLRALFHRASPKIQEKIKWGMPAFEYKGIVGQMAGFKQHVRWGLWKAKLLNDPIGSLPRNSNNPMGAGNIKTVKDLPSDRAIIDLIKQAVALNEAGTKLGKKPLSKRPPPKLPADLARELKKNSKAMATYKGFSPSHQREYIEWITGAKQPETRQRRITEAVQWMAQGKARNWKYERC